MIEISSDEFNSLLIEKLGIFPERAWYKSEELELAGTIILDPFDKDWSYMLLAKDEDGFYRPLEFEVSLPSQFDATSKLLEVATAVELSGSYKEDLYQESSDETPEEKEYVITTIDDEVKKYLKSHPEKLYQMSPRKFEELVASILKDMGFEVELTQATRDGGRDIIAHVRNAVTSYLTYIECKRYAPDNKVGVGIIREVLGVHHIHRATKSIIVTTSFFSDDAMKEAAQMENQLDLKDFNDIKKWLGQY
ncbi:restriction endonuclease [Methylococcaceae bacterium WWC4]|nr:restriction endonuclease [Methylococcaceae bacterium WWC4]